MPPSPSSQSPPPCPQAPAPITVLLQRMTAGDAAAEQELYGLVYSELRRIAESRARPSGRDALLQPTALVNEAYLKLSAGTPSWDSRAHFFGAAGRAMRNIIVDEIRKRSTPKHGGHLKRTVLNAQIEGVPAPDQDEILDVDQSLQRLEQEHPRAAKIVDLRFFAGLSDQETADALQLSVRTVFREWAFAKAWLSRDLATEG